jgi:hypothetical protein
MLVEVVALVLVANQTVLVALEVEETQVTAEEEPVLELPILVVVVAQVVDMAQPQTVDPEALV